MIGFQKRALLYVLIMSLLVFSSCSLRPAREGDGGTVLPSETVDEISKIPGFEKLTESITASREFKSKGLLKSVRVYFDNAIIGAGIADLFPDEDAVIKYKTEHDIVRIEELRRAVIGEAIRSEITSALNSLDISTDDERTKFGTSFAHVSFSELDYADLISLCACELVTGLALFDEGSAISLDEKSLCKISADYDFGKILDEALPDDEFEVGVLFDFVSEDEKMPDENRLGDFLDNRGFDFGTEVKQGTDYLTGKMRVSDIVKLVGCDEVSAVWLDGPLFSYTADSDVYGSLMW